MEQLTLTQDAADQVKTLLKEEQEDTVLRLFVQGGGCSGFTYGFMLEDEIQDDDYLVDGKDSRLVVDTISLQYLTGATIDYIVDLQGSRFTIKNPNVVSQCGCGSSFAV
jgi:iron-sulfur cluster insertion protein